MLEVIDGVSHTYANNPKLQGERWEVEFPPINTEANWLRCRFTGQIYPNFPEFAERSDILEPYFGSPTDSDQAPATSHIAKSAKQVLQQIPNDNELTAL